MHSQASVSAATPSSAAGDNPSTTVPSHGPSKSATSTMQMQYTTAAMQVPPYGSSPQNIQQHFQLTTGVTSAIGSDSTQQQR